MKTITETKLHRNNLRKYGLKIGDKVTTTYGLAKVTGICEIESYVNSFEFDKGGIYTYIKTELENGTEYNAPTTVRKYSTPLTTETVDLGSFL